MAFKKFNLQKTKDYSKQINDIKIPDISTTLNIKPIKKFNLKGVKSLKDLAKESTNNKNAIENANTKIDANADSITDLYDLGRETIEELQEAQENINDNSNGVWQNSINNEKIKNNVDNIEEILQETREDVSELEKSGNDAFTSIEEEFIQVYSNLENFEKSTFTKLQDVSKGLSDMDTKVTTLESVNNHNTEKVEGLIDQLVGNKELGNNDTTDNGFSVYSYDLKTIFLGEEADYDTCPAITH